MFLEKSLLILRNWPLCLALMPIFWGWSRLICGPLQANDGTLETRVLRTVVGLGVVLSLLVTSAVAGLLHPVTTFMLLAGGGALAARMFANGGRTNQGKRTNRSNGFPPLFVDRQAWIQAILLGVLVAYVVVLGLRPLTPPMEWDELSFHFTHAREWAERGYLSVNRNYRFAWSPVALSVLWAACMQTVGDVFPHVLNACFGFLTAALLIGDRRLFSNATGGLLAAGLWFSVSRPNYMGAMADLGITLFVFSALTALRREEDDQTLAGTGAKASPRWGRAAMFLVGVSLTIKYQGLLFAPPLVLWGTYLAYRHGGWREVCLRGVLLLLPCAYWFGRNWLLTGNPIEPLAPSIFGYFDWDVKDYAIQLWDIQNSRDWPRPVLWLAVPAILFPRVRRARVLLLTWVCAMVWLALWFVTSHYARYLLPAMPLLAALATTTIIEFTAWLLSVATRLRTAGTGRWRATPDMPANSVALSQPRAPLLALSLTMAVLCWTTFLRLPLQQAWHDMAYSSQHRDDLLTVTVQGYRLARSLPPDIGPSLMQLGLEGTLYYLPRGTRGDVFGPWRHSQLDGTAEAGAHWLCSQGIRHVMLNNQAYDGLQTMSNGHFFSPFKLLDQDPAGVRLFYLPPAADCTYPTQ